MWKKIARFFRRFKMKKYSNNVPKYVYEMIAAIEKAEDRKAALKEWGLKSPLNYILAMNFDSRVRWDLPEGMPPLKPTNGENPELYPALASNIRRIMVALASDKRLTRSKKEFAFIEVLESINPEEAQILVFAKDKALTELYPFLTYEFVASVHPDFCHKETTWLDKTEQ